MAEILVARRPRRGAYRQAAQSGAILAWLAAMLSAVVALFVIVQLVIEPQLRVSRVIVESDFEIDRTQLLWMAGLSGTENYFQIRPEQIRERLLAHPVIREAEVVRVFPNTVRLTLTRRRPLALALVDRGGMVVPVVFDEYGTVFEVGAKPATLDLPVVSGLQFEGALLGSTLPDQLGPFLRSLRTIKLEAPELFALISEYRLDPRAHGGLDIVVYPESFRVPVRVSDAVDRQQLTYMLLVLDVMEQQGLGSNVRELDFRSGEVVYRMKEGAVGR